MSFNEETFFKVIGYVAAMGGIIYTLKSSVDVLKAECSNIVKRIDENEEDTERKIALLFDKTNDHGEKLAAGDACMSFMKKKFDRLEERIDKGGH